MARLETGSRVGRYEVVSQLGRGGMAVVYQVRDVENGKRLALKVLALDKGADATRLAREGRLQAALSHPNILALVDVVTVVGHPALVLEFVDGLSLSDWLLECPQVTDAIRWRLAKQILAAVGFAHQHGMIHRDLKPQNVLITINSWEYPTAKVCDFGLAKWLHGTDVSTQTGVRMGTPRYMAPEQFLDAKRVDERADVFSLGCLLFDLWAGRPAFQGDNVADVFDEVLAAKYTIPPNVPREVAAAIRGALNPDIDKRIQSVNALTSVLDGVVPVTAPFVGPSRAAVFAVVGVGCVVAIGPLVILVLLLTTLLLFG